MKLLLDAIRDTLPQSAGILALGALALLAAVVAIVRARDGWTLWLAVPFGALALAMAVMIVGVGEARSIIASPAGDDPSSLAMNLARGLMLQMNLIYLGLGVALVVILVAGVALTRAAVRAEQRAARAPWPSVVVIASCLSLLVAAIGRVLAFLLAATNAFTRVSAVAVEDKTAMLRASILEALGHTQVVPLFLFVIALAVAAAAFAAVGAARRGLVASNRSVIAASLLFGVGLLAFFVTRPHAADRDPLPMFDTGAVRAPAFTAPTFTRCAHPVPLAPLLTIGERGATLDGRRVDADELQLQLVTLKNNARLIRPSEVFDGTLLVLAPATFPIVTVLPYLEKAERAGFDRPALVAIKTQVVKTATVGTLNRIEVCALPLSPRAADGRATWGELATP